MPVAKHTNRLIHETSPYLLQHAHNPVDWYPWNAETLDKARVENKPILLSIGYSACHWCHVMEHESFEDEDVATVMNSLFVCIKVDREERPDLDKIYQIAHQMLAQRPGGWPLNMFLTPDDHTPFFGGTYFPKQARHGMPAFTDILQRIADFYRDHRGEIDQQNASVHAAFARINPPPPDPGQAIEPGVLDAARREIEQQYEPRHGGFGGAPKFPHPTIIERCLRHWAQSRRDGRPDDRALAMARHSLQAMADGGLYDQLGGGFCRYSVDERWMIPHFEKMLYDNAQLLPLYVDAYLATGDRRFRRVALETGEWVLREMQSPEGGYYSTLDADSEGHEGKFYVWTPDAVKALLSDDEYRVFAPHFGLDRAPNFEDKEWHLHVFASRQEVALQAGLSESEVNALIDSARLKLLAARERRVRPGRDEKVLTSWNGMMIKAMAHAGRALERPDFTASAGRALDFVRARLYVDDRLFATYKDGRAHLAAYLDDYAFLIDGVLALLQARWRGSDLSFATELAETLLDHYEDTQHGGFFFTADDHERLLHRPKPTADDAIPSGNGVAAQALLRLGHVLGTIHYLDAAELTLKALYQDIRRFPSGHNSLLVGVEEFLYPPETVVLRGAPDALAPWITRARSRYAPRRLVLAIPDDAGDLPGMLAERRSGNGVIAYVCSGHSCQEPIGELDTFDRALAPGEADSPEAR